MKEYMFKLGFKIQAKDDNELDQKIAEYLVSLSEQKNFTDFIINKAAVWESEYIRDIEEPPTWSGIEFLRAFRGGK